MQVLKSGNYFGRLIRARRIGSIQITESRYRPFEKLPAHAHDEHVLIVAVAGNRVDEIGSAGSISCQQGSVRFHPAAIPHAHRFGPAGSIVLNIPIAEQALEPFADLGGTRWDSQRQRPPLPGESWLAARILAETILSDSYSELALSELVAEYFALATSVRWGKDVNRPAWLDGVLVMLQGESTSVPSLSRIASGVGKHPAHVARCFRKWQGCSIGEFLRRRQLVRVVEDLAASNSPISEIALRHGFWDQAHLTRVLRSELRITPGRIRQRIR